MHCYILVCISSVVCDEKLQIENMQSTEEEYLMDYTPKYLKKEERERWWEGA